MLDSINRLIFWFLFSLNAALKEFLKVFLLSCISITCNIRYTGKNTPPPQKTDCCTFSPPLLVPALLPSRLIPAAMSSGSALSHLINRNLCYNDLSMSLWLYAYAMRAGNPVALVADFEAFFTHSSTLPIAAASAGQCKAGTLLALAYTG